MFYDRFYELCQEKGCTPTQVARDLGIRQSTVSMWKLQGTTPKYDTLRKLADYFGSAVDELVFPIDEVQADIDHLTGSVQADSDILIRGIDPVKEAERWRKENHEMVDALNVYGTASAHDFLEFLTKDMKNTDKTKE